MVEGVVVSPILMDSIGLWNTRGLNKPTKLKEIHLFMHNAKVELFGLLETKVKRAKFQQISLNLCQDWLFSTNLSQHRWGGYGFYGIQCYMEYSTTNTL